MEIFVNAAALHDIPHLATIVRRAVLSQVISGAGGPAGRPVTLRRAAFTGRIRGIGGGPYQRMANPS